MIRSRTIEEATLDPQVVAELEALDAALRGDTVDDEQLVALVRDVRAQAPEMPSDLRKRLRHEVSEGFPSGRRGTRRAPGGEAAGAARTASRRRSLFAGGGVLAGGLVAVIVVIAVSGQQSGTLDSASSSLASGSAASTAADSESLQGNTSSAARAPGGSLDSSTVDRRSHFSTEQGNAYLRGAVVPQSTTFHDLDKTSGAVAQTDSELDKALAAKPQALQSSSGTSTAPKKVTTFANSSAAPTTPGVSTNRKVERAVDMAVRVKSGKLGDAVGRVGQIARSSGGYVSDSQTSLRTRGAGDASFTLRVASAKLDAAVGALSALGTVTHQDQQSQDITSSFDSAQSRLDDATKVRAALLRALAKATTAGQIASLKTRIADNRKLRASLATQLGSIQRRADLTTIGLTLSAPTSGAAAAIDDNGHWTLGDALRDTGHILTTVTGGLLVAAGAALPFAILALLAWPVYRARRRRLREATLGS